jgi:heat shock protein HslJ
VIDRPHPSRARGCAVLALTLALVIVAAACGGDDDSSSSSGSKSGEVETTPASASDLSSQHWQLKSFVVGSGGTLSTGSEAAPATAAFDAGTTTGSTGCNNYTVTYDLGSNGAIKFGPVAATKAACSGDLSSQEQGLLNGYGAARRAVINDGALQLLGPGGNPLLIFTPVKG